MFYLENRPQQEIQLGLSRIQVVAERLELLNPEAVVITVAGTNGKGSTVATLETIYSEAGYCVGAYTSPHLLFFNERIRLNQKNISDESLCRVFSKIEEARGSTHLTYFEMATLAALLFFKQSKPDLIILEVGMGGRLDATNIIDSDLAIITTIDFDHMDFLGNTIDAIAYEKAGILRKDKALIYADKTIPSSIIKKADELNVKVYGLNQDYSYNLTDTDFIVIFSSGESVVLPKPTIHPHAAAAGVVATRFLMAKLPVAHRDLEKALEKIYLAGRQQVLYGTICTVFDVSHNPQSVDGLVERIKQLNIKGKIHAVFSGLKDKDLSGLIKPMHSHVHYWYTAALDYHRTASDMMLKDAFQQVAVDANVKYYHSITTAYRVAQEQAKEGDLIVVYGSFYVVGPILLSVCENKEKICSG